MNEKDFLNKIGKAFRDAVKRREAEGWVHDPEDWEVRGAFELLKKAGFDPMDYMLMGINYRRDCIQLKHMLTRKYIYLNFDGKITYLEV